MIAQFGKWNFDGKPVDPRDLERVRPILTPYGPDGEGYLCKDNIGILCRVFHTTKESRTEVQPHVSPSGVVITWDGRIDNRAELINNLKGQLSCSSSDLSIVASAYEQWGTSSFGKMVGDWAVSIWDPRIQSLVLAKDFLGTRHLFYCFDMEHVSWCTILDPLVLFATRTPALEEEYIAGLLSFFPAAHLSPYEGIHSVAPSSFVRLANGMCTTSKYWDFDPGKSLGYHADTEYEEHFRSAFAESVRRRLRSDAPVLAELSGGIDSSSIVCVADTLMAHGGAETTRVDTISYYDDSEPNWNERPYFTRVEAQRGRKGCHIRISSESPFKLDCWDQGFAATPLGTKCGAKALEPFASCMRSQGNRVLLSGAGGDEVAGGLPTPIPELTDDVARAQIKALAQHLRRWALHNRKPWVHLLFDVVRRFLPPAFVMSPDQRRSAPWLAPDFLKRNWPTLAGYPTRLRLFGALPSFQEKEVTLDALRRQLACDALPTEPLHEKRYPFLDRDFLEFIRAVPPEQLVRPGQRRSLLRRSLAGIVPGEVLDRRRKAYVVRRPMAAVSEDWNRLAEIGEHMVGADLGIFDESTFRRVLQGARRGVEIPVVLLARTLDLEHWMRGLQTWEQHRGEGLKIAPRIS